MIVIGAGPAGSLAATLLARGGVAVTLIEQSRFPRDKVCGECLSALGLDVLRRHGLFDAVWQSGRPIRRSHVHGVSASAMVELPAPMLGLSRSRLDAMLLDAAAAVGARVVQPARAETVTETPDRVDIRVRRLVDNRIDDLTADVVLVADGRDALGRRPAASGDFGIKAHFEHVAADPSAVTLYGGVGGYGGVAPVEDGRWDVAFAVPRAAIAAVRGDLDAWWAGVGAASPAVRRDFTAARRVGEWLSASLPRHAPPRGPIGRVIPVGAAAGAIEPVGGEGMGTALYSAELAANALIDGDPAALPAAYASLWRRRATACRWGGRLLADERVCDLVGLADHAVVAAVATWAIGK